MIFNVEDAVKKRYSVRNYIDKELEPEIKSEIKEYISKLANPFNKKIKYTYIDNLDITGFKAPGTYGVIKGAKSYIGISISNDPMSLASLGYEFESAVLYMASKGVGTCWLGGTFDKKEFHEIMNINKDEIMPIISPYGYAAEKKHIKERAMRKIINADKRKEKSELFFNKTFNTPITFDESVDVLFAMEMVRLGPSASNKQPWRILKSDELFHFYEYKEPGYSNIFKYDIQRIDIGIAAAHFDLALKERGIRGKFNLELEPDVKKPKEMEYVFTWHRI